MWLDYKSYKHWELITPILAALQLDLEDYLKTGKDTHRIAVEEERKKLGMNQNEAKDWYIIPVVRSRQITEWASDLPRTCKLAERLPGVVNLTLSFFAPGVGAPPHSDYDYDMREDITNKSKCYAILLGVKIPSNIIELGGFQLGNEKILLETNCIMAFDGGVMHTSWNHTDQWRYSSNIDIDESFWELS
jgi:hypothetical protein